MFSRYKKPVAPTEAPSAPVARTTAAPSPASASAAPRMKPLSRPGEAQLPSAQAVAADKEKKKKERMGEIRVELHRRLLDNLNLAACHACMLVPETSCEKRNCFLDRALLVGLPDHPEVGYFSALLAM